MGDLVIAVFPNSDALLLSKNPVMQFGAAPDRLKVLKNSFANAKNVLWANVQGWYDTGTAGKKNSCLSPK